MLLVGACLYLSPVYDDVIAEVGSVGSAPFTVIGMLRDWLPYWVAVPPVFLAALWFSRFRPAHMPLTSPRSWPTLMNRFSVVASVTADQRRASLAELLALLVEHEVPLHEALPLAARAIGDRKLTSTAGQVSSEADLQQSLSQDSDLANELPPFLRWALTGASEAEDVAHNLRLAAKTYRHRAQRRAQWLRVMVPTLACVFLAGGVTLLYCLSMFGPLIQLIRDMS